MEDKEQNIVKRVLVEDRIYVIRGVQVMLDSELAEIYEVPTKALNQAVKRNIDRFPNDFMFQLSDAELENLRSQFVTAKFTMTRSNPFVFTEQGVYMLATVLKSKIASQVNLQIMRIFVKLKNQSVPYFDIIKRLEALETDNKETKELLYKVVQVVSGM